MAERDDILRLWDELLLFVAMQQRDAFAQSDVELLSFRREQARALLDKLDDIQRVLQFWANEPIASKVHEASVSLVAILGVSEQ